MLIRLDVGDDSGCRLFLSVSRAPAIRILGLLRNVLKQYSRPAGPPGPVGCYKVKPPLPRGSGGAKVSLVLG